MPIALVRIDDRLIHGQVLEGWLPSVGAREVIVANDALAEDSAQKAILAAAVPLSIDLIIATVEFVAAFLRADEPNHTVKLVLVETPEDALRLKRAGAPFERLNLGNIRMNDATVCLSRSVNVDSAGLRALNDLMREGVEVNLQSVPFEKPVKLADAFKRLRLPRHSEDGPFTAELAAKPTT